MARIRYLNIYESNLDDKTVKHAFKVYDEIYIGFTDGDWIGICAGNDPECDSPQLYDAPGLEGFVDLLEGFQWDIVAEFEKAGIIIDGSELRAELKKRRQAFLRREIENSENRLKALRKEQKRYS